MQTYILYTAKNSSYNEYLIFIPCSEGENSKQFIFLKKILNKAKSESVKIVKDIHIETLQKISQESKRIIIKSIHTFSIKECFEEICEKYNLNDDETQDLNKIFRIVYNKQQNCDLMLLLDILREN